MSVFVYVEGPSDRTALEAIFVKNFPSGKTARFLPLNGKGNLMRDGPRKSCRDILSNPNNRCFVVPDLYPVSNSGEYQHTTARELCAMLQTSFESCADQLGLPKELWSNFKAHCLMHDMEVLLLADPDGLRRKLRTKERLEKHWRRPPEEQNNTRPPKRVVSALFEQYLGRPYDEVRDAAAILDRSDLERLRSECATCFAPFATDLLMAVQMS